MDTLFTAVVQPNTPDNTLNADDQIIGGENAENHMQITLKGDFMDGMGTHVLENGQTVSNFQNIQQVDLINPNNQQYQFNAQNTQGVEQWNLINTSNQSGNIELFNLPEAGIVVGLQGQIQGAANIGFAPAVVTGTNDSMTVELTHVGRAATTTNPQTVVNLNTRNVENLTLVSNNPTGTVVPAENFVDLTKFSQGTNLTIQGAADLSIIPSGTGADALPTPLQKIDGTAATGDITIQTNAPTQLKEVLLGSGNDEFNVNNGQSIRTFELGNGNDTINAQDLYAMATIRGGDGNDTLNLTPTVPVLNYHLNMSGVETLEVVALAADNELTFDGSNTTGLETLNIRDIGTSGKVNYVKANQSDLDVNILSTDHTLSLAATNEYSFSGVQNLNVNLSGNASDTFQGKLVDDDATTITLNTGANSKFGDSTAASSTFYIHAANASTLTINTGSTVPTTSSVTLGTAQNPIVDQDLTNIANLIVNGRGNVNLSNDANIGIDQGTMIVQAGGSDGNFSAVFGGSANTHIINVTGSATGTNSIQIGGTALYDQQINVDGSTGDDNVQIYIANVASLMQMVDEGHFNLTLLTGTNTVTFLTLPGAAGDALNITLDQFLDLNKVITGEGLDKSDAQVGADSTTTWGLTIIDS